MPKMARAAGTQWGGLNLRVDPTELPPEQSPDCANVFFYDQTLGLLGPRLGKGYAGATDYNIWGVFPYSISGQLGSLIAYGDNASTNINLLNLYSVTIPPAGWGDAGRSAPSPTVPTGLTRGFFVRWLGAAAGPSNPASDEPDDAVNISVNGATSVIATCGSSTIDIVGLSAATATIVVSVKFDLDDWIVANTISVAYEYAISCMCEESQTIQVTQSPVNVDCTGKTAMTGIKVVATTPEGTSVTVSGDIFIVGTAATLTTLDAP